MNPQEAMVMEYGIIKYVGSDEGAKAYMSDETEILDMKGRVGFEKRSQYLS